MSNEPTLTFELSDKNVEQHLCALPNHPEHLLIGVNKASGRPYAFLCEVAAGNYLFAGPELPIAVIEETRDGNTEPGALVDATEIGNYSLWFSLRNEWLIVGIVDGNVVTVHGLRPSTYPLEGLSWTYNQIKDQWFVIAT